MFGGALQITRAYSERRSVGEVSSYLEFSVSHFVESETGLDFARPLKLSDDRRASIDNLLTLVLNAVCKVWVIQDE